MLKKHTNFKIDKMLLRSLECLVIMKFTQDESALHLNL